MLNSRFHDTSYRKDLDPRIGTREEILVKGERNATVDDLYNYLGPNSQKPQGALDFTKVRDPARLNPSGDVQGARSRIQVHLDAIHSVEGSQESIQTTQPAQASNKIHQQYA